MSRRLSAGDTLVSHRGGRTCGLPMPNGRSVTSLRHPARSCARVAHSVKASAVEVLGGIERRIGALTAIPFHDLESPIMLGVTSTGSELTDAELHVRAARLPAPRRATHRDACS